MKKETVRQSVNMLDDAFVKEASVGRRFSLKAVTAAVLAVAVMLMGVFAAQNSPSALIGRVERQANAVLSAANTLDDYSDGEEAVLLIEEEIYVLTALAASTEAGIDHLTPARDAVNTYKAELEALRERAKTSLEAFREAAKEYKEGEQRLTREQRKALREKGTSIRRSVNEAGKARRAVTAKEIAAARRNGDTDRLNGIYADICTSIETGMAKLNSALDNLDALTERLSA